MSNEEWKSSLTRLEQLKAVRDYVDENPVNFTVSGETESDEQTFIRYYDLMNRMLPALLEAAEMVRQARSLISEAVNEHIYDVDNGDVPEPDCRYMAFLKAAKTLQEKLK